MQVCSVCDSFVPARVCPECDHRIGPKPRTVLGTLLNVAVSATTVVTLAACYGVPIDPVEYCDDATTDLDGDGYCGTFDCDEGNASRHDFAFDSVGDGIDQNCDGVDGVLGSDAGPTP